MQNQKSNEMVLWPDKIIIKLINTININREEQAKQKNTYAYIYLDSLF